MRHAQGSLDDSIGLHRPGELDSNGAGDLHALRFAYLCRSCPAYAIKRTGDGVVQSARKPRCIACNNCVIACPFGVPKMNTGMHLMMKCDMCYDRTSVGKKPMCASVCLSQALFFGTATK
jgi:Fe-S-cluster-containing dehydrogenase component